MIIQKYSLKSTNDPSKIFLKIPQKRSLKIHKWSLRKILQNSLSLIIALDIFIKFD